MLTKDEIRALVFDTFGLHRFLQDSPIRPDVWERFLTLAARGMPDPKVALILTPKQSKADDGRPAGRATELSMEIVTRFLATYGPVKAPKDESFDGYGPEDPRRPRFARQREHRIAATSRHVAITVTFSEMMQILLPLTSWWERLDESLRDPAKLAERLLVPLEQNTPILQAITDFDNTEFVRFMALAALTQFLLDMNSAAGRRDFPAREEKLRGFIAALTPQLDMPDEDEIDDDDPDSVARRKPPVHRMREIGELWTSYTKLIGKTFRKPKPQYLDELAAILQSDIAISVIQRNRRAARQAGTATGAISSLPPSQAPELSRNTIKADAAQRLFNISTAGITWAVVDTGIDATHEAFLDSQGRCRVVATLDFTALRGIIDGSISTADLMNRVPWGQLPQVPDAMRKPFLVRAINTIRDQNISGREIDWTIIEPLIRLDPKAPSSRPADPHGTHVAGILGGNLPAGISGSPPFFGICPDIQLYDLRVFSGEQEGGDEFTILAALDYISWVNRDPERPVIHGVNLSLAIRHIVEAHACGGTPICDAANRMVWTGTVVVAAAGNFGFDQRFMKASLGVGYRGMSIADPGNAQEVITVGATHRSRPHTYGVSYFSSRGPTGDGRPKPDLVAPGEKIRSTIPGNQMLVMDGTSMAAPHVSGVCAMIMARHDELIGEPTRIKEILMKSATDLGREHYFQGAGLVDALRALQSI
jgi:subtilisin family serine protease